MMIDRIPFLGLSALHAISEFGDFKRAAEFQKISIPALSKRISSLEYFIGEKMLKESPFDRRKLELTKNANNLLSKYLVIFPQLEGLAEYIEKMQKKSDRPRATIAPDGSVKSTGHG